ncbi:gustatory receptor [Nesidiocoris tenuis]|uniref:Gustatory receptor n=1 Tax=Nesidiocoris tenuis TaxID=355587 RepID=A0ABN7AQ25_9HEMI|nr:gustatory receptor [Nesidiocoris tenuis]
MLHAFGFSASYFPLLIFGSILEVLDTRVIQLTDSIKFSTTPPLLLALCEEINDLTNMIRRLSSFYGPTILICFVFFFNDLIWCCYYSVILLFDEGPYNKIVLYQAGAVYHLFAFFLMSKACEDHYRRVEAFHWEMYDLMCSSELLCKHEKLKLFASLGKTVEFSCCGFFTIGYPMVTSIIAAAATYLVILIQFSLQNE